MAWYNSSWLKRKAVTLTGGASGAQTDYQVKLTVTYDSDMQVDFDDLRFTKADGTTLLDAWLESKVDSTSAIIWVETDTPANTVEADIYMYYSNSGAASAWNGANTFPKLFDDFEDNDVTDWSGSTMVIESTIVKTGTYSGKATTTTGPYKTGTTRSNDYVMEFDYRKTGTTKTYLALGAGGVVTTNCVFLENDNGTLRYYDGSYHAICNLANDTWHKFIISVDYTANTFDITINGASQGTDLGTRGAISNHNDINPYTNSGYEYLDNIFTYDYVANPATYVFGSEETPTGGWVNKVCGVTSPARVISVLNTSIGKVIGV